MKKRWYVIDSIEHFPSYNAKTESAEHFKTKSSALLRAHELANSEPTKTFLVCEATDYVVSEAQPPKCLPTTK